MILTLTSSLAGISVFIYYLRLGQFDNCEEVKYQVFHDGDEVPEEKEVTNAQI